MPEASVPDAPMDVRRDQEPVDAGCQLGVPCETVSCGSITPFQTCIMVAGDQACPESAPNKHSVGDTTTVTCDSCPCTGTAVCEGSLAFYLNSVCNGPP
jgi:hypothetical protein